MNPTKVYAHYSAILMRGVFVLAALSLSVAAWSQNTSIEELEQRLQKAKEEKQRRDAAAAKAKGNAQAGADRNGSASRSNSRLVVSTDAPCTLTINGTRVGNLQPGAARTVAVLPGQQLVECASDADPSIKVRATPIANGGTQQLIELPMAAEGELATRLAQTRDQAAQVAQRLVGRWEATKEQTESVERLAGSSCADGGSIINGSRCDFSTCSVSTDLRATLEIEIEKGGAPQRLAVRYQRANNHVVSGVYDKWEAGTKRSLYAISLPCSTSEYFREVGQTRFVRSGSFTAAVVGPLAVATGPFTTVDCSGTCSADSHKPGFRDNAELRFNGDRLELWFAGESEASFSFTKR